jgi:hypothetical protein
VNDAADPSGSAALGDTPGPLGVNDYAESMPGRGAHIAAKADDVIRSLERQLDAIQSETATEIAKTVVDLAGLVDPTPISDAVGAVLSLKDGDLLGAGLSVFSMVPYLGDAVGKPAKAAKSARKLAALKAKAQKIREAIGDRIAKLKGKTPVPDDPKTRFDYFDGNEYPNSPYEAKNLHPHKARMELEAEIDKQLEEALEEANDTIAKANREIQELHEEYIKTGNWRFDGFDDWQFPDDALKQLRQKYKSGQ